MPAYVLGQRTPIRINTILFFSATSSLLLQRTAHRGNLTELISRKHACDGAVNGSDPVDRLGVLQIQLAMAVRYGSGRSYRVYNISILINGWESQDSGMARNN